MLTKNLAVRNDLCTRLFPACKSVFTDKLHVKELNINDGFPDKDSIFPDFEIIYDLIKIINEVY